MVRVRSYSVQGDDTHDALRDLTAALDKDPVAANFVFAFYSCTHDDEILRAFLAARFPGATILGGTSCSGVMSDQGFAPGRTIGVLAIEDNAGEYGAASSPFGDSPGDTAEEVLQEALKNASCPGELPELIWVYQTPGQEEDVIEGLRRIVGDSCPIIGGSAADDAIAGQWRVLTKDAITNNGIAVAVLFSSGGISYAFQGGYEPLGPTGIVTSLGYSAMGKSGAATQLFSRQIQQIDGVPAAEVYNSWTENALGAKAVSGGNVLFETTMYPLAVSAGKIQGVERYRLIHPERVLPGGVLSTFAAVTPGTRLHAMRGDRDLLIERAGRVATQAVANLPGGAANLAGGLVVYCAGCRLAVDGRMPEVADQVTNSLNGAPFLGCFTFGEQGQIASQNVHGNLMISAVVFGQEAG
jgi:hypothetical protein